MTGGGFGGAIVCLCRHDDIEKIRDAVAAQYFARFNINASIYVGKAGHGLQVTEF
jgi:galactokinase